jgi:CYTH domain-containing protein
MPAQQTSKKGQETEVKFLVPNPPPELIDCPRDRIRQGYLVAGADGTEVRLRKQGKDHFLTVKGGKRGASRLEEELPISRKQFDALWPLTRGRRLRKVRYRVPHGDLTIEVDVYRGKLKGLVVAEVEFPDGHAPKDFHPPPWFGRDVTRDPSYANAALATGGRPDAQAEH